MQFGQREDCVTQRRYALLFGRCDTRNGFKRPKTILSTDATLDRVVLTRRRMFMKDALPPSVDVIVVGLGAMGSATCYQLATRGHSVIGLDKFSSPHAMGSSHGKSRIIREAYFENPLYVPLVQRAYASWNALEKASGTALFRQTGGLMLGPPDGALVRGARLSAEMHGLPHEILSSDAVHVRFPVFMPTADMVGVWEPRAGVLAPERAIAAALDVARRHGAQVRLNEPMVSWRAVDGGVEVTTATGMYRARRLVLSLGAWMSDVVPELALPLKVQRNVKYWFTPERCAAQFTDAKFPVFISEYAPNESWYGIPDSGEGLALALHLNGEYTHPERLRREVADAEVQVVRGLIARYLPDANGPLRETAVCMYTNTPDEHFIVDRHPAHAHVILASPCSGHGFKFSSVLGEVLADLATDRTPAFDLRPFRVTRFRVA